MRCSPPYGRGTYQRRPKEWTNTETAYHESDRERDDHFSHVEFGFEVSEITSNDSTCKCNLHHRKRAHGGNI